MLNLWPCCHLTDSFAHVPAISRRDHQLCLNRKHRNWLVLCFGTSGHVALSLCFGTQQPGLILSVWFYFEPRCHCLLLNWGYWLQWYWWGECKASERLLLRLCSFCQGASLVGEPIFTLHTHLWHLWHHHLLLEVKGRSCILFYFCVYVFVSNVCHKSLDKF